MAASVASLPEMIALFISSAAHARHTPNLDRATKHRLMISSSSANCGSTARPMVHGKAAS